MAELKPELLRQGHSKASLFPRLKSRGRIEAAGLSFTYDANLVFPRLKSRGRIEATALRFAAKSSDIVSTAEKSWPN